MRRSGTPPSTSHRSCSPRSCARVWSIRSVLETNLRMLKGTFSISKRPASILVRSNTLLIICSRRSAHSFKEMRLSFWSEVSLDSSSRVVSPSIPWIGVLHYKQNTSATSFKSQGKFHSFYIHIHMQAHWKLADMDSKVTNWDCDHRIQKRMQERCSPYVKLVQFKGNK
jgi:hypothetical protein